MQLSFRLAPLSVRLTGVLCPSTMRWPLALSSLRSVRLEPVGLPILLPKPTRRPASRSSSPADLHRVGAPAG